MSIGLILAALTLHSAVTNGVEVRWFEDFVPMGDGVTLYTYGSVPADGAKCPIIVMRDPYVPEKRVDGTAFAWQARNEIKRGYASVFQHVRGAGLSHGKRVPYETDREDGLALLDYVRRLPWYDGELFLKGGSYCASVHWSYLDTNPPDVKGAYLLVQMAERYGTCYRNGFFKATLRGEWYRAEYCKNDHTLTRNKDASFFDFPLIGFSQRCWGRPNPALDNIFRHPRPDDPFWRSSEPGSGGACLQAFNKSKMPVFLKTGLYDCYVEGVLDMWRDAPPERRANCVLRVDACDHVGARAGDAGGAFGEFPDATRVDPEVSYLDWFDSLRRGGPCPGVTPNAVRYYAIWENKWHVAPMLEDGPRRVAFRLGAETRRYAYDPKRPLPDFPGSGGLCLGGLRLQPEPNFRDDVLSFVLPPLAERLDVRGRMTAKLTVSSDCEDTCFYARVSVRKPDGRWYLLRDDITSLSYQLGDYVPGTKRAVAFRFADHAFRLEPGDVLRMDVASACNHFAPHTNVKGDQFAIREPKVAHNAVFGAESELVMGVLK